ncbi:hypothetical protein [Pseudomonas frederiksbergensis]|uniref:hypothetical protein n=1 Tax=Pseudomonas frederiksbergensis TaxID=104087 RepID=UPI001613B365|nr:hypothetical protein [Pseudomonas frederiksbergensis]
MKYHLSSGKKAKSAEAEVQSFFQAGRGEQQEQLISPKCQRLAVIRLRTPACY